MRTRTVNSRDSISARPACAGRAVSLSRSPEGAHGFERALRYVTAAFDQRLAGKEFGGYRLEHVLGQGRFGTGFLARPACGGSDAFAKLVKRRGGVMQSALDIPAVWAECAALSLCDHPGIPQWLGIVNERRRYFIVESLMPGRSLSSWLAEGRVFSREETAAIGAALISIVGHLALRGVVHNDIRPANVLLAEGAWGCAHALGHETDDDASMAFASLGCDAALGFVSAKGTVSLATVPSPDSLAIREARQRMRISLVDFGLAEFFDRAMPEHERMAACAPDVAGIAEVVIGLLYSNRMNIRATAARDLPWFEALLLTAEQRHTLEDMFQGAYRSFDDLNERFLHAFG